LFKSFSNFAFATTTEINDTIFTLIKKTEKKRAKINMQQNEYILGRTTQHTKKNNKKKQYKDSKQSQVHTSIKGVYLCLLVCFQEQKKK